VQAAFTLSVTPCTCLHRWTRTLSSLWLAHRCSVRSLQRQRECCRGTGAVTHSHTLTRLQLLAPYGSACWEAQRTAWPTPDKHWSCFPMDGWCWETAPV